MQAVKCLHFWKMKSHNIFTFQLSKEDFVRMKLCNTFVAIS